MSILINSSKNCKNSKNRNRINEKVEKLTEKSYPEITEIVLRIEKRLAKIELEKEQLGNSFKKLEKERQEGNVRNSKNLKKLTEMVIRKNGIISDLEIEIDSVKRENKKLKKEKKIFTWFIIGLTCYNLVGIVHMYLTNR